MPIPPIPPPVASPLRDKRLLFSLVGANMNSTADQALIAAFPFTAFLIDKIDVTNASASLTTAVGGFYGAPSKAAPILVSAAQAYASLTAADGLLTPSLTAAALKRMTTATMFLSLTVAQGSAATADIYVWGAALA